MQQQTRTPLIGTYHRRGEYKKQEIVAQARPWRRQKKRIDLHKKNILLPFPVSARRFGFGPPPFPARLVIVVVGSSRALGGSLNFQRTPGSGSSNTAQSKNRRLYCMEFFVYEGRAFL
jgi:hypothetical protein